MNDIQNYVVGFMFDKEFERVALIRKNKPEWQRGKLNGIGGKIEEDEHQLAAMVREFEEETDCTTAPHEWSNFAAMSGSDWNVYCYCGVGPIDALKSAESEPVEIVKIGHIDLRDSGSMIENIPWLIAMALDHLHDKRPLIAQITYPS